MAKGIVYCLFGLLVFMAAFHIDGHSTKETDKTGVFNFIYKQPGGEIMLGIIALGLVAYCFWRGIQTFGDTEHKGKEAKGLAARCRYFFSGLVYASLAGYAVKMLVSHNGGSGDNKENVAQELMTKPLGQWMVGVAAAIFAAVGIYQAYYGLSEKYKKHTDKVGNAKGKAILLSAGKIGYVARGLVWLLIAWLFAKAALHSNSSQAGDSSKAFAWLNQESYGTILLVIMALGLICYGIFNFVRVRYEKFD